MLLDGKNADEIIEYSNKIRLDRRKKSLIQDITELEDKKQSAKSYIEKINEKFRVKNSTFLLKQFALTIEVQNNTKKEIQKLYLDISLANKNQQGQIIRQSIPVRIAGGAIPSDGSSFLFTIPIKKIPGWVDTIKSQDEIDVNIIVTGLDDEFNRPVFKPYEFTEEDSFRLTKLKAKLKRLSE